MAELDVPFSIRRHQWRLDLCFEANAPLVGDERLAGEVEMVLNESSLDRENAIRYSLACRLRDAFQQSCRVNFLRGPIYTLTGRVSRNPEPLPSSMSANIIILPSFDRPSRHIKLFRNLGESQPLHLLEVWHANQDEYGPVEPDQFVRSYPMLNDASTEHEYRQAVIEIIKSRLDAQNYGVGRHPMFFPERYELLG
ncbi:hypothetical protein [Tautonia marina]|uniref:hypothetical protein n=1 Tax=Tautonia marina TaxID=2653855 RepID=UPI0012606AFB|nr:hypothetical protein [Tautonia marina]